MTENQCVVVLCSCPDEASAARLAAALVTESLAACVQRMPGMVSNFRWEGTLQEAREVLLLAKSTQARLAALVARVRELHPYELPEVVAVPVLGGLDEYLAWVRASVTAPSEP